MPKLSRDSDTKCIAALVACFLLNACGEAGSWDAKMQVLCAKDGGMKIYEKVILPKDQFDQFGMPRGKEWDRSALASKLDPAYRYSYEPVSLKRGDPLKGEVEMFKSTHKIYRQSDGKLLGESITYGRSGGDSFVARLLGGHPSSASCPAQPQNLVSGIFTQGE